MAGPGRFLRKKTAINAPTGVAIATAIDKSNDVVRAIRLKRRMKLVMPSGNSWRITPREVISPIL